MESGPSGEDAPSLRTIMTWMQLGSAGFAAISAAGAADDWYSPPPLSVWTRHL